MSKSNQHQQRATTLPFITIPQRAGPDVFSSAAFQGTSPSPMTIVSNFFADNFPEAVSAAASSEFRGSFSQLLAGAMASPSALTPTAFLGHGGEGGSGALTFGHHQSSSSSSPVDVGGATNESGQGSNNTSGNGKDSSGGSVPAFKQNRPAGLMVPVIASSSSTSSLFPVSPGFSPSAFFNSPAGPGFFPPALNSPFGISHQQALAQVTAAAVLSQSTNNSSSTTIPPPSTDDNHHHQQPQPQPQPFFFTASSTQPPAPVSSNPNQTSQYQQQQQQLPPPTEDSSRPPQNYVTTLPVAVDKPADDGYNWRKYGQKPIKGSEYPRSYYKCTIPNCPVKKKVERSRDGRITEIIYRGQHTHEKPQPGKRNNRGGSSDHSNSNNAAENGISQWSNVHHVGGGGGGDEDYSAQDATSLQLHGPSDSEESGEANNNHQFGVNEEDDDVNERNPKRRNTGGGGGGMPEAVLSHKTVTEPKIIVQTRSQVDLLDDGYRWRKYGQKVVKGNPNPRSYYKCTTKDCNVRKHIERSSTDAGAVITTYEGKHNHDIPVGRNGGGGGRSGGNNAHQGTQSHNAQQSSDSAHGQQVDFGNHEQRPIAFLRLKEEQLAHPET